MDTKRICSICGKALAASAPEGLCPECLLKAGIGSGVDIGTETEPGAGRPSFVPPGVAELAPLFPQLEILELIGKGGMGAVYRARQKQLNRLVALKILPPDVGHEPAFAARFTREAQALALLNHPGIVTLYEFGSVDATPPSQEGVGGAPATRLYFFLMEFVDGVNLRQLLHAGRVSPREALAIVSQICDALQFAHDQGIVHRDIKPENILMDRRGRVKVADFGLAKIVGQSSSLSPDSEQSAPQGGRVRMGTGATPVLRDLTEAGKIMGTPQYMSPEQIHAPGEVDHRADIYALGVVFYQLLTGELPGKHIEPPSKKVHIDVRLDEVVLRALEKEPERRYQQVSEVKTDVETIASGATKSEARSLKPGSERGVAASGEEAAAASLGALAPWLKAARWTARILGTLFILFALPFVLAEGLPAIASQPGGVQMTFVGGFLLLLGFVIGWWREGRAALLIAAGWTAIRISESGSGILTVLESVLLVAGLYAFCWWTTRGRKTTRALAVVAALAVLLALGRLFCPVNVFVSGVVADAATRNPIPAAELRLLPRPARPPGETDRPNMRSDKNGHYRLYVGWYCKGQEVQLSAPGYDTKTVALPPRPAGRRWLNQDYQLAKVASAPSPSAPLESRTSDTNAVADTGRWRARIAEMNAMDWRRALATANEVAALPPEEGLAVVRQYWTTVTNAESRKQFLKAFNFSKHPRQVGVLELGVLDPSPEVQNWAFEYLKGLALRDFATDYAAAKAWLAERRDKPLADAVADSALWLAGELRRQKGEALQEQLELLGRECSLARDFPDAWRKAGLDAVLAELCAGKDDNIVAKAIEAAGRLSLDDDWARRVLLPRVEAGTPLEVRLAAFRALGSKGRDWALEPMLTGLTNAVLQAKDRTLIWTVAQSLAEIGSPSVIPAMIGLIEAENTYETVYGIGYFGLGKLTGVKYDGTHNGAWWRQWWEKNKQRFSADVQTMEIPVFEPVKQNVRPGQSNIEDEFLHISAKDHFAGGNTNQHYWLIHKAGGTNPPGSGYRLLLVLPGGDGGPDFRPFVQRIYKNALPDDFLVAELIAPKWDAAQFEQLVWPTEKNPYPAAKFSTEEFLAAVLKDIQGQHPVASNGVFTLSWSSGGPAAYAASLDARCQVAGSFVAMSVFKPEQLSDLTAARGKSYFLLQSPKDFIPFRMVEDARDRLTANGARVRLQTYEGGHGWHGDVYGMIRAGITWLEEQAVRK